MIITSNATRIRSFFAVKINTQVIIYPGKNEVSKTEHDLLLSDEPVYARAIENNDFIIGTPEPVKVKEEVTTPDDKETKEDKLKLISENFDKKSLAKMLRAEKDATTREAIKEQLDSIK